MENSNSNLLVNLFNYPDMCVFGLINSQDHKIYLGYTINLSQALARIIKETKSSNNKLKQDWNKLELIILSDITDRNNLRVRHKLYFNEYSNKGWVFYNKISNVTRYKLRLKVVFEEYNKEPKVHVKLLTRRYKEIPVGVFETMEAAKTWCDVYYPDSNNITNIIYQDCLCK